MHQQVLDYIDSHKGETISLLQEMVQIPSPTYQEGDLARFVEMKLKGLGLFTFINVLGDITGIIQGHNTDLPLLLFNTHLDQADVGDMENPFSGEIKDGREFGGSGEVVYGRGTNGQKAALAGMIMAVQAIQELRIPLNRGVAINGGVMEECGGHISPRYLLEIDKIPVYGVVCGEHTNLRPVTAHRGMINLNLEIRGKGSHAAAPEGAKSALVGMAEVVLELSKLNDILPQDKALGKALVSLNKLFVSPNVSNVIPDLCTAIIDIRHPASAPREEIVETVKKCVEKVVAPKVGLSHTMEIKKQRVTSYTGVSECSDGCMYPFFTPKDSPFVGALIDSVEAVCGFRPETDLWKISSETGYFSTIARLPVVAFGPGEDRFTHNSLEHVRVEDVMIATKVYAEMLLRICT